MYNVQIRLKYLSQLNKKCNSKHESKVQEFVTMVNPHDTLPTVCWDQNQFLQHEK